MNTDMQPFELSSNHSIHNVNTIGSFCLLFFNVFALHQRCQDLLLICTQESLWWGLGNQRVCLDSHLAWLPYTASALSVVLSLVSNLIVCDKTF